MALRGHLNEIYKAVPVVATKKMMEKALPTSEFVWLSKSPVMKHRKLYVSKPLMRKFGRCIGESQRITIKHALVMENATRMPAEIKSSKYWNGTQVAIRVMAEPEMRVPVLRFPDASTRPKIPGNRPSFAKASCNRGCAINDIKTTTGNVKTSPAAAI